MSHVAAEPAKKGAGKAGAESKPAVEYSAREVSPPALLLQQLRHAHCVFRLHHGPSLSDLFVRSSRDGFCNILARFWTRFCRTWDVLLHGNPATDVFDGTKLASGGELGFGVGEEDWGSGEREVLEDLTHRTEGLVDVVVLRFGEPAPVKGTENASVPEEEALPWLGGGHEPVASDGVVFGGVGGVAKPSLRDISLWMRQIYTYGENAYGVRDNPLRERRKRRRHNQTQSRAYGSGSAHVSAEPDLGQTSDLRMKMQRTEASKQADQNGVSVDTASVPNNPRPQIHNKAATQDHAEDSHKTPPLPSDRPGIPEPVVSAAEQSLSKATKKADIEANFDRFEIEQSGSTMGIPDQYMKYLTFGLSELAKPKRPPAPKRTSTSSLKQVKASKSKDVAKAVKQAPIQELDDDSTLARVDPMPDGESLRAKIAEQKRLESHGYFVIGLKGDLSDVSDAEEGLSDSSETGDRRTVLRTLQVEVVPRDDDATKQDGDTRPHAERQESDNSIGPVTEAYKNLRRLRVLVYVHRPFVYCLLFEKHTSSLQYARFYNELHRNLIPIHNPLLSSTSMAKVSQRIEASHNTPEEDARSVRSNTSNKLPSKHGGGGRPIYDLIYDPRTLTLHCSIPNIPEPGTPAAKGLITGGKEASTAGWSRLEALNVHSQILNTLASVKTRKTEMERTSKTTRGWWVVWMKVPPSAPAVLVGSESTKVEADSAETVHSEETQHAPPTIQAEKDMHRMAFLVRKSSDAAAITSMSKSSASSGLAGGMLDSIGLGSFGIGPEEKTGGAAAGWGPQALTNGIGIDARRYVEGLLSLNR